MRYYFWFFDFYLKDCLCNNNNNNNNMAGGVGDLYSDYYDDYNETSMNALTCMFMGIAFVCLIINSIA